LAIDWFVLIVVAVGAENYKGYATVIPMSNSFWYDF
jgi:hypothetical protein